MHSNTVTSTKKGGYGFNKHLIAFLENGHGCSVDGMDSEQLINLKQFPPRARIHTTGAKKQHGLTPYKLLQLPDS
jgi:hypothetical protein